MTGEEVKAARDALGESRTKFAARVGLTSTKVANIEKGRAIKPEEEAMLAPYVNGAAPITEPEEQVLDLEDVGGGDASAAGAQVIPQAPAAASAVPPPSVDPNVRGISNSELQTFKRCRRKWWLAFYRHLGLKEPEVTGPRSIGTRIHHALSVWYRAERLNPYEVLNTMLTQDLEMFPDQAHEIAQEGELCRAMLEGYFEWIQTEGADEGLVIIGDEQTVSVPSGIPGINLMGRLDVRAMRTIDNAILFMDHKTVGSLSEPVRTLHMDEQMLMYHLLEFLNNIAQGIANDAQPAAGGLYNMLRKVKRTQQAKPPFFDRVEVRHNIDELRSFYVRVHGEIQQIIALQQQLDAGADPRYVAYPTPTRNCTWDCDFFPVCPMFDDGSNAEGLLEQLYQPVDAYARYDDRGADS